MDERGDGVRFMQAALAAYEQEPVVGLDAEAGVIGLVGGRSDRPQCICGSRTFGSCDATGAPMPISGEWRRDWQRGRIRPVFVAWPGLFVCGGMGCNRLVNGTSRAVVGFAGGHKAATAKKERATESPEQAAPPKGIADLVRGALGMK